MPLAGAVAGRRGKQHERDWWLPWWPVTLGGLWSSKWQGHIVDEYVDLAFGAPWTHSHLSKRNNIKNRLHGEVTPQTSGGSLFRSSDRAGGSSFSPGKADYTSARCLHFLEEKLYPWSGRKICFEKSFLKCCCPCFRSRRSLERRVRGKLSTPPSCPLLSPRVLEEAAELRRFTLGHVSQPGAEEICFVPGLLKSLSLETREF